MLQCSFKICAEVIDVFDADAEAEHVRVYACCYLLLRTELRVSCRCRVYDKRLRVSHAAHMEDELEAGYQCCRSLKSAFDPECKHSTEAMLEVLACEIVVLVALKARVVDTLHCRVFLEELCDCESVRAAALSSE